MNAAPAPTQAKLEHCRKKPVLIQAIRWWKNGDHPLDCAKDRWLFKNGELHAWSVQEARQLGLEGDLIHPYFTSSLQTDVTCALCKTTLHQHGWLPTREGGLIICPGDWIITDGNGEHRTCKPDDFAITYEKAEDV